MNARRRRHVLDGLLEEPHRGGAEERQERGPAEDVYVGFEGCLLLHQAVDHAERTGPRGAGTDAMGQVAGDLGGLLLQDRVGWRKLGAKIGLVEGGAADQGGGRHGDADRAADVAQHVEQAGGVAHLLAREGGGGQVGQGHKDKAEREAGNQDGDQQRERADGQVHHAEVERADAEPDESRAEQLAVVDVGAHVCRSPASR